MKKLIAVLLITIIIAALLCACGEPSNPEGNIAMKVVGYSNDTEYIYYIHDRMTDNMYVQFGSGKYSGGLSPLYDEDGTIMKYDEWLRLTSEYNVNLYGASD
jgi:hypothetical protein